MKALAAAGALVAALIHTQATSVSRLQVVAKEYSYTLSRLHLHAGTAVIELDNFGQDPHDLRVQRIGAKHIAGLGTIAPGGRGDLTVKLVPGRYSFWCSLANHRQLGMHAVLVVTR
ncbi:MAG TPA: cupredoxin domain-containing protein [Gaiellaceae bacterium]|nr:cupredoxin domain-containing protein [Gaiellaceae bacterium]